MENLKNFIFPKHCVLCENLADAELCELCCRQFLIDDSVRCKQCAIVLPQNSGSFVCGSCLANPPAFDQTFVVGDYQAPLDRLVLALKMGKRLPLASILAQCLFKQCVPKIQNIKSVALLAVPLGQQRLQQRGFNQAQQIAKEIARLSGWPILNNAVIRSKNVLPQMHLSLRKRHENVRDIFRLQQAIPFKHVLVVDDVMTTGATLNELARLLRKETKAEWVTNLVFARTPYSSS